jgi:hypothetical protein
VKRCDCLSPKPWENNRGQKSNVCKECGGKIPTYPTLSNDIGRATIALDAALRKADFRGDDDRHAFIEYLIKGMDEKMRQSLLTFRANRVSSRA